MPSPVCVSSSRAHTRRTRAYKTMIALGMFLVAVAGGSMMYYFVVKFS